ncbi:Branched-chain-amino-acid aminotransferase, mitochondrial [Vanrija pseudolonga]|uniref:Branched-chain-amino-acid aminotransferase, mitochondrial n=1 Tax=Vanrija pseudolonga TaxID=143232 RepID=A0AAF1BQ01_9TREE|nr:Branched-chain-amino-acid aminotransferase, mitochondrial [Vanrija pseudolonga]
MTVQAPLKASSLYFSPVAADHPTDPRGYGRYMLTIPWSRTSGWGQPKIGPRQDLSFDPLAGVLQYAVTCFEGMKCYKDEQGKLRLFRPNKNFDRLKRSAARVGLPDQWDNAELVDLLSKLVALEAPMVPAGDGDNLYIRPTLLETSESFGIKEDAFAAEALLYVVTSVNLGKGLYASSEGTGLRLDACNKYIRAWPGGTGSYKLGANYGTVSVAKQPGFAMSLWLHSYGKEDFISEAGAMNVWIIKEAKDGVTEFVTMSLDNGIVLPGVTRESIITLLNDHASGKQAFPLEGMPKNIRVVERDISMNEIVEGTKDGSLKGMFGCGTGVVVVQVGLVRYQDVEYNIPANPLIKLLRDTVTGIQRGRLERDDWSFVVPEWDGSAHEHDVDGQKVIA